MKRGAVVGAFISLAITVVAQGGIPVGSGANMAQSVINFSDGAAYTFDVLFDGTTTGIGLFDIIEANTSLETVRQDFGFGVFIDGITFDGHSNIGFGGGDNWWHYWTMESGDSNWTSSFVGAADRTVTDGDSDGWVYGFDTAPVPEPATALLLCAGCGLLLRRRSRAA